MLPNLLKLNIIFLLVIPFQGLTLTLRLPSQMAVVSGLRHLSHSAEQKLFFLDQSGIGHCKGVIVSIPSKKERTIFNTNQCPDDLLFDFVSQDFYFVEKNKVYKGSLKSSKVNPSKVADLPELHDAALAISAESGRLVVSYLVPVPSKNVKTEGPGEKEKQIFVYQNKRYEAQDLPGNGNPYMAIQAEWTGSSWKTLEVKPTRYDPNRYYASNAPGLGTLPKIKSKGFSIKEGQSKMTCEAEKFDCDVKDPNLRKVLEVDDDEMVGRIQTASGNQFVFPTAYKESLQAMSPVIHCDAKCLNKRRLEASQSQQLAFALKKNFLLVAHEYYNEDPEVYDSETGKLIYQRIEAKGAVWLEEE